jgi:hypothetical protein
MAYVIAAYALVVTTLTLYGWLLERERRRRTGGPPRVE